MSFEDTLAIYEATATELTTADDGVTWTIAEIDIEETSFSAV